MEDRLSHLTERFRKCEMEGMNMNRKFKSKEQIYLCKNQYPLSRGTGLVTAKKGSPTVHAREHLNSRNPQSKTSYLKLQSSKQ
jgi:hypothetical protein